MAIETQDEALNYQSVMLKAGRTPFQAEFYVPDNPDTAIVLVDGLSAKRDSKELFINIEDQLTNDNTLLIKGDLSDAARSSGSVLPLSKQARRLNIMMEYANTRFNLPRVIYIGRSLGAVTIALSKAEGSEVLLLNPPMDLEEDPVSDYPDQSMIEVGDNFWNELKTINIKSRYEQLARRNEVHMIFAGDGPRIASQPIADSIRSVALFTGAEPNFSGSHRLGLINLLQNYCQLDIAEHRTRTSN